MAPPPPPLPPPPLSSRPSLTTSLSSSSASATSSFSLPLSSLAYPPMPASQLGQSSSSRKRTHPEMARSTSRSLSPRPAKRYRTTPLPTSSPAPESVDRLGYHAPNMASSARSSSSGNGNSNSNSNGGSGSGSSSSSRNHHTTTTIDLTIDEDIPSPPSGNRTLESTSPHSDLFELIWPSPSPELTPAPAPAPAPAPTHESGQRPHSGQDIIEIVDLVDFPNGDETSTQAMRDTPIRIQSSSPDIEFVGEQPARAPLQPRANDTGHSTVPAWVAEARTRGADRRHAMVRALDALREGTEQLLRSLQLPLVMQDGQAGNLQNDSDDLEIVEGDDYARINLNYQQAAFAMHNPVRQNYQAPPPPSDGFIRSYAQDSVLICPMCQGELGENGGDDDDPKHQVWIVKACGHVYCGHCALQRTRPKSAGKRDPRKSKANQQELLQFRHCKVDGCNKPVTAKQSMVQIYL